MNCFFGSGDGIDYFKRSSGAFPPRETIFQSKYLRPPLPGLQSSIFRECFGGVGGMPVKEAHTWSQLINFFWIGFSYEYWMETASITLVHDIYQDLNEANTVFLVLFILSVMLMVYFWTTWKRCTILQWIFSFLMGSSSWGHNGMSGWELDSSSVECHKVQLSHAGFMTYIWKHWDSLDVQLGWRSINKWMN